jgi:hypothetical protein
VHLKKGCFAAQSPLSSETAVAMPGSAGVRWREGELGRSAAHSTGEDRMNSLVIAVIAIAVAQALTILLIIGREREIKKLRELVTQQRIFISEIKGWLMRERVKPAQPRRIKPDREPMADEIKAPEIKVPEIAPEIKAPEIVVGSKAPKNRLPDREPIGDDTGVPKLAVPEPAKTLKELLAKVQPQTTEDGTKEAAIRRLIEATDWLKKDADKARSIIAIDGNPSEKIGSTDD